MFNYIVRRLLLLIPTFFGTTFLVFFILQIAPSGPFEQALLDIKKANMQSGEAGSSSSENFAETEISPEMLEKLKREYGLDKSIFNRYLIWLGFAKKELEYREVAINTPFKYTIEQVGVVNGIPISLQKWIIATTENDKHVIYETIPGTDFPIKGYKTIEEIDLGLEDNWTKSNWKIDEKLESNIVSITLKSRQGVFTGYLGESTKYKEGVGKLLWERIHISSFLGITGFLLSYLVCIPLGIMKALKHGSKFDMASSGLVFIGYSIPAYAFGILMIWVFSTSNFFDAPILPSRGWRPEDWDQLSMWGKFIGQIKHALLPTLCYTLGSFATLTVLMKNSLMENMSQDYVRTAFSKGLKEKTVIIRHAVRNSLIPLATGIGGLIGIFLAGSYLIEKVFAIDGIGLLSFKAIGSRDYGIIMGFLVIGTIIRLLGNLISDLCYAAIDPRIRFK